tara:strand:- start:3171 stop:4469 length:1299 start_codon:yes stop_codon:yes gene_type:complete
MDNNIILPSENFNFDNISILSPSSLQGKTFLSKIQNNNSDLYIQTPKCISKNGFTTSGKKTYIDLLFEKDNDVFIEWIENLESKIQEEIYNKKDRWFRGENIEKSDIEDLFTSPIKTYKSGKYYLLRVFLGSPRVVQHNPLNIFDENENPVEMDDINSTTKMITILQLHGLKFSINVNFQIYIELKQALVIDEEKMFQKPLFKMNRTVSQDTINTVKDDALILESVNNPIVKEESNVLKDNLNDLEEKDTLFEDNSNNSSISEDTNHHLDEVKDKDIKEKGNSSSLEDLVEEKIETQSIPINNKDDSNIVLENELETKNNSNNIFVETETNPIDLVEFNPDLNDTSESFTIKKPDDVYMELYKDAKEKAKKARLDAIKAYMELKHIKQNYQIDDLDSDNEFSESEFQSSDEESENDEVEEESPPKLDFVELS